MTTALAYAPISTPNHVQSHIRQWFAAANAIEGVQPVEAPTANGGHQYTMAELLSLPQFRPEPWGPARLARYEQERAEERRLQAEEDNRLLAIEGTRLFIGNYLRAHAR